jgi:iron complex transport system ATP-binding protein
VLHDVNLELLRGETLCLLGPNGVGKTTLFKTMLGLLRPLGGRLVYNGEDTAGWSRRRFARTVAYIPQNHAPSFPFTAFELVLMGRTPQLGAFSTIAAHDEDVARRVMDSLGIGALAQRDYTELSGGERQMVLIARALAQEPDFLVMDEPTASLDFGNQARVLERIRTLSRGGLGVIMTTHDPNQAFLLGGKVACMDRAGTLVIGAVRDVVTPELLGRLYGIPVAFATVPTPCGTPVSLCTPLLDRHVSEMQSRSMAGARKRSARDGSRRPTAETSSRLRATSPSSSRAFRSLAAVGSSVRPSSSAANHCKSM